MLLRGTEEGSTKENIFFRREETSRNIIGSYINKAAKYTNPRSKDDESVLKQVKEMLFNADKLLMKPV